MAAGEGAALDLAGTGAANGAMAIAEEVVVDSAVEEAGLAVAEAEVEGSGLAVIGRSPGFIRLAQVLGAAFLDILPDAWTWEANVAFMDAQIAQGATILLSTAPEYLSAGMITYAEVQYFLAAGYTMVGTGAGTTLFPPGG